MRIDESKIVYEAFPQDGGKKFRVSATLGNVISDSHTAKNIHEIMVTPADICKMAAEAKASLVRMMKKYHQELQHTVSVAQERLDNFEEHCCCE